MKFLTLFFFFYVTTAYSQQTIDKLNSNQLKLPKETVNRALILDATGQVKSSPLISDTELSYLDGLTATITSLLSGKANDSEVVKLTTNQSISGTKTFTGKLVASSTVNGSTPCPVMTETQRNAFTPVRGDCVYNSTSLKLNVHDGSVWKDAGGSGGVSLWTTSTPYIINDVVIESNRIYRCLIAHTSGTFSTDLAASRWVEVSAPPVTPYSLANVDQSRIAGASNFPSVSGCVPSRTSSVVGPFTATAACPAPVVEMSAMGSWQTTDSDLPRQTINNLPSGTYKATFSVGLNTSAGGGTVGTVYDGTSSCTPTVITNIVSGTLNQEISCVFTYTSSGNRSFELYVASDSGATSWVNNRTAPLGAGKFRLEYFGSGSVYSSTNADTGWTDCGHTASDFIGFGTVASIQTQCKRSGDELLMRGRFTATTAPTATEARVALKLSGTTLTSKNSTSIATVQHIGDYYRSGAATSHGGAVLIEPSVGYVTFTDSGVFSNATVGAITKANGSSIIGAGESISINARIPINDWDNSNIIIGQFNEVVTAPGVSKPKTCYYAFGGASATLAAPTECTTGTCVEVVDTCGAATPPTRPSLGAYTSITFSAGTFANSSAIKCECSGFDSVSGNGRYCAPYFTTGGQSWASNSSGGYIINLFTSTTASNTLDDTYVFLKCEGQAP